MKSEEIIKKYKDLGIDVEKDLSLNIVAHEDDKTGNFIYSSYVEAQTKANIEKITSGGPKESRLILLSGYIKKHIPNLKFGICHGTRNGQEQKKLKEQLGITVLGTEISHTAKQFSNTIQWDFHEVKEEWLGNVSFIFSNSLDHSYDPIHCLSQWMKCISPNGKIFLQREDDEMSEYRVYKRKYPDADLFHATEKAFSKIVAAAGNGNWIIKKPDKLKFNENKRIIVLERKR